MDTENYKIILHTADMFKGILRKFLAEGNGLHHPETLISSASRMAGTLMFRSLGINTKNLQPGQMLLSPEVNEKSAQLTNVINATLEGLGDNIDLEKAKASLDVGSTSKLTLLETQERFEPLFMAIVKTVGLSLSEASTAASIATAILIHDCRNAIEL